MNISKLEQRVLHALAQGGAVRCAKDDARRRVLAVDCFTRDGLRLADCTLAVFASLRRKRLVESRGGGPYRISRRGLAAVRAQLDNR